MLFPNVLELVVVTGPKTLGVVLLDPNVNVELVLLLPNIELVVVVGTLVELPNELLPNVEGTFGEVVDDPNIGLTCEELPKLGVLLFPKEGV